MVDPVKRTTDIERLEARISSRQKSILKNAADLSGRTLTDFVISSAFEAALRVIQENQLLHPTAQDSDLLVRALLKSSSPSEKLIGAVKKYKKDVTSK